MKTLFGRKNFYKKLKYLKKIILSQSCSVMIADGKVFRWKWRHGVGSRYVWSKYDHNNKTHKTTVQGVGGQFSYSGFTSSGSRAEASWEKALSGNRDWADVK